MYVLVSRWARSVMAWPFGIAIAKEAPESIIRVRSEYEDHFLITVGDVVTINTTRYWRVPDLALIDARTRRTIGTEMVRSGFDEIVSIRNEPATLSLNNILTIKEAVNKALGGRKVLVVVDGEEDLLAIPAVLAAPRRSIVMYGLYTGYLIVIPINELYKMAFLKLLVMLRPRSS
ncbi:MAG: GTP-dependent dephospho-CoA kinase family protein [Vulcanisaeta sp.]|nr:GTP-dependent dephospho-CoA kinase family protein [Vulcanisaeta sp.]